MGKYKNIFRIGIFTVFLVLISLVVNANTNDTIEIKKVMADQETAWNNGDLEGFMAGYWKSDQLKFIGKNGVTYGWQNIYDNYKKSYPNKEAMGTLTFEIVSIEALGKTDLHAVGANPMKKQVYMVVGKWKTSGTVKAAQGYFTLIFKKINGSWLIVTDHTS